MQQLCQHTYLMSQDDDLRELRDTREWMDMLGEVKGGMTREQKVSLRAEAKAPFRLARITLFGGLAAGAGLGLLIIIGRLVQSIKGGPGAPPLEVGWIVLCGLVVWLGCVCIHA
jgi:hypothetical protein